LKTREAYNVIVKRIEAKTMAFNRNNCSVAFGFVFGLILFLILIAFSGGLLGVGGDNPMLMIPIILFGIFGFFLALKNFSVRRAKVKEDEEVKEVAILRRNAAGPSSALQLPDWLQERQNKRSGGTTFNDSSAYYGGAAACGVSPYTYRGGGATGSGGGEEW
jgi:hypothetical protein